MTYFNRNDSRPSNRNRLWQVANLVDGIRVKDSLSVVKGNAFGPEWFRSRRQEHPVCLYPGLRSAVVLGDFQIRGISRRGKGGKAFDAIHAGHVELPPHVLRVAAGQAHAALDDFVPDRVFAQSHPPQRRHLDALAGVAQRLAEQSRRSAQAQILPVVQELTAGPGGVDQRDALAKELRRREGRVDADGAGSDHGQVVITAAAAAGGL